ncbi:hypothetical protein ACFQ48_20015 [Hymenobacter caeli]|uniref:Uncharacterized protein n=1 Tax=Hymenobacter caeli TaxID=2735894 RepID=A0ABX2FVM0_9BACT|nr:hypothetical protein [Hymenobacter caeli]NRT21250.1 hypothetical protein [Hymenobacter caeli]
MTTAEFWNQQQFSYLVTHSFNRGPKLAALHEAAAAIEQAKQELQQARFMQRASLLQKLRSLEEEFSGNVPLKTLSDEKSVIGDAAEKIAVIERESAVAQQLSEALQTPNSEEFASGCVPIYRDALAFYDDHDKLLRVLNICFQCLFMQTDDGVMVEASVETYYKLRELLLQLGHPIETAGEQE